MRSRKDVQLSPKDDQQGETSRIMVGVPRLASGGLKHLTCKDGND